MTLVDDNCRHDSLSGDEGPIVDLGRMPQRWRCDACGAIVHDPTEGVWVEGYNRLREEMREAVSRGPDNIISDYLSDNSTTPSIASFNVQSWDAVAVEIVAALEDEGYRIVHKDTF